jgi:hypothetical protein
MAYHDVRHLDQFGEILVVEKLAPADIRNLRARWCGAVLDDQFLVSDNRQQPIERSIERLRVGP